MTSEAHIVQFRASGRGKAQCPPNPNFPNGIEVDASMGEQGCVVALPYPAPECGLWIINCAACGGGGVAITAAGRADDPKSVKIPCQNRPKVVL